MVSLQEIAQWLGLSEMPAPACVSGASIDSRTVKPGDMFICISGQNTDGHNYVREAVEKGASCILAARHLPDMDVPVIVKDDVEAAFQKLAVCKRKKFRGKVIAVTGTAGKTTLKDVLAAILGQSGKIAYTEGNHNNQLGLPLTIMNARDDADYWILELGISHSGDMQLLGGIAIPDMALILNAGPAHTAGLGKEGIAWHKTRLLQYLDAGGIALVNSDYPDIARYARELNVNLEFFGTGQQKFNARKADKPGDYILNLAGEQLQLKSPFTGNYGLEIVAAAASCARLLGLSSEHILNGMKAIKLPHQRFNLQKYHNIHIFDDTYNASPFSMQKMLDAAAEYARDRHLPLYLFLGEMGELGEDAAKYHQELGRQIAMLEPALICWKGGHAEDVRTSSGIRQEAWRSISTESEFLKVLVEIQDILITKGGVLLFKGSRLNKLEQYLGKMHLMPGLGNAL